MNAWFRHFLWFFLVAVLAFAEIFGNPAIVQAAEAYVPFTTFNDAPVPDWNNISFSNFPALQDEGAINFPSEVVGQLGYNPSRSWQAGSGISDVLMLGDVQDAFGLETLTLDSIAQQTGLDLGNISLSNLPLLRQQTISTLASATPGLGELRLSEVKPVADLVNLSGTNLNAWSGQTISAIAENEFLGNLSFDKLPLDNYSLTQIPGLNQVPLGNFQKLANHVH